MLTAGSLKDRVIILAPVLERGEMFGEQTIAYVDVKTVWAKVDYRKGSLMLTAGESWMNNEIGVTMRYNSIMSDRCRLRWDGKMYEVESLNGSRTDGSMVIIATRIDEGSGVEEE